MNIIFKKRTGKLPKFAILIIIALMLNIISFTNISETINGEVFDKNDLKLYYSFDDTKQKTNPPQSKLIWKGTDMSGNSHTSTGYSSKLVSNSKFGNAMYFNKLEPATSYMAVGVNQIGGGLTEDFSIEAWIFPEKESDSNVICGYEYDLNEVAYYTRFKVDSYIGPGQNLLHCRRLCAEFNVKGDESNNDCAIFFSSSDFEYDPHIRLYDWNHVIFSWKEIAGQDSYGNVFGQWSFWINGENAGYGYEFYTEGGGNAEKVDWKSGDTDKFFIGLDAPDNTISDVKEYFIGYIDEFKMYDIDFISDLSPIFEINNYMGTEIFLNFEEGNGQYSYSRVTNYISGGCALYGNILWNDNGKFGKCVELDGSDDYISIGGGLDIDAKGFAIECWLKPFEGGGTEYTIFDSQLNDNNEIVLNTITRKIITRFQGSDFISVIPVNMNKWNHIVFTYDGTNAVDSEKIYINGKFAGSNQGSVAHNYECSIIGKDYHNNNNKFKGLIDEVKIYGYNIEKSFNQGWLYYYDFKNMITAGQDKYFEEINYQDSSRGVNCYFYNGNHYSTNGKYDGCIELDGSTSYGIITDNANLNFQNYITIEAWIRPNAYVDNYADRSIIINKWDSDNNNPKGEFRLWIQKDGTSTTDGKLGVEFCNGQQTVICTTSEGQLKDFREEWHHVAATFIKGEPCVVKLFFDGKLIRCLTSTSISSVSLTDENIYIGRAKEPENFFDGYIDEIRISNYPRNFHEDYDGDTISDINEIMRSTQSDQYNPMEYNGRYGLLVAPIKPNTDDGPSEVNQDLAFKFNIMKMRNLMISQGWSDRDIIFLTTTDDHSTIVWNEKTKQYETWSTTTGTVYNGYWIDGEAFKYNIDGHETLNSAIDAMDYGGDYQLQDDSGNWQEQIPFCRTTSTDTIYFYLNDHGAILDGDPTPPERYFCTIAYNSYGSNIGNYWEMNDFDAQMDRLDAKYIIAIIDMCYSGNWVNTLSENNRIIISSDKDEKSWDALFFFDRLGGNITAYKSNQGVSITSEDSHNENQNADGCISIDANYNLNRVDLTTSSSFSILDNVISLQEAYYFVKAVNYDQYGGKTGDEKQTPQISVGSTISNNGYLICI